MEHEMKKHIDKFKNFLTENSEKALSISDFADGVLSTLQQDLSDAKWAKKDSEINYEDSKFYEGKIKGIEMAIEKIEKFISLHS